ncbi:MAG: GTP-binding protein [Myxococcales bacterium]|nr:GTP-binding protein [Myxococcales bacterium]
MAASGTVPVHLVAGFLGAGKTTAIRKLLESRRHERVALIVNDFGEASFDEVTLSEEKPFAIQNIPGGCVCCTAPEGFVDALGAVIAREPDRLVIEPTGLARPQDLIDTIRRSPHAGRVELGPVIVLVDPRNIDAPDENTRELLREQAEAADILIANRRDLAEPADLERFDAFAAELWPGPIAVYHSEFGQIPGDAFAWPEGHGPRQNTAGPVSEPHEHRHEDSTKGFRARTWRWPAEAVFSYVRLQEALARAVGGDCGRELARFKGIFRTQEGTSLLEISGGVLHDRLTSYRRDSRADAILVQGDDAAFDMLGQWLEEARLSEDELTLPADRIQIAPAGGEPRLVARDELAALPEGVADVGALFPKRSGAAASVRALFASLQLPERGVAVVVAADGFASEAIPVPALCAGYLLHSQEAQPLSAKQGGPFRLLIPDGTEGVPSSCANVKGVVKIVLREA